MYPLREHNFHPIYRPDIDGLRAVAVISVVVFHGFPTSLPGGFVGVDIFFVISGFLISSILFKSLLRGDFSFTEFYAHRVKRIFPALFFVLVASYVFGWFALLPYEFKQLGKHIASGAWFLQNFVLWKEVGYFDTASELKPLLHLWSLAIEEQFYLIYPLLIWAAWRVKLNVLAVIALIAVLSFGLNISNVERNTAEVFFSPQTRFWELLAGSLLAYSQMFMREQFSAWLQRYIFYPVRYWQTPPTGQREAFMNNLLSITGLTMIMVSLLVLNAGKLFPGWWALVPVTGAVLLILAGQDGWVNRNILSNRLLVYVGLISYPLYLWHWPLLAFLRIVESGVLSFNIRVAAVMLSFLLASLTYHFLEKPIRFGKKRGWKTAVLCMLIITIGSIGFNTFKRDGLAFRGPGQKDMQAFADYYDNNAPELRYSTRLGMFEKTREECNFFDVDQWRLGHSKTTRASIDHSCYTPKSDVSILLWGDSHAQQLNYGLQTALPKSISILQVASSACPAQVGDRHPTESPSQSEAEYCRRSNEFALKVIEDHRPQVVVIAQMGGHDKINDFSKIAAVVKAMGVKNVIVLGPVPRWNAPLSKIIINHYWRNTPQRILGFIYPLELNLDKTLRAKYSANEGGFQYISMTNFLCNSEGCLTYLGNDPRDLVAYDHTHLTSGASIKVAKELLAPAILRNLGMNQPSE